MGPHLAVVVGIYIWTDKERGGREEGRRRGGGGQFHEKGLFVVLGSSDIMMCWNLSHLIHLLRVPAVISLHS